MSMLQVKCQFSIFSLVAQGPEVIAHAMAKVPKKTPKAATDHIGKVEARIRLRKSQATLDIYGRSCAEQH